MDSMVERAARAMARRNYPGASDADVDAMWDGYVDDVRAVITAMMEPTPAMIDRFVSRALCVSIHGDGGWSNYAREQWQTMVQAALSDTKSGISS